MTNGTDDQATWVKLENINVDPDLTIRSRKGDTGFVDEATVNSYVECLDSLPPIMVYKVEGEDRLLLADGFHRMAAFRKANRREIEVYTVEGTRAEAGIYAATANLTHGRPLTSDEVRLAGRRLLAAGMKPAHVAKAMLRSREWVSELQSILHVRGNTTAKAQSTLADSYMGAVHPAGLEAWGPMLKVVKASGMSIEDSRKLARLVAEDDRALKTVKAAAEAGKGVKVVGSKVTTLLLAPETPDDGRMKGSTPPDVAYSEALSALVTLEQHSAAVVAQTVVAGERARQLEILDPRIAYLMDLHQTLEELVKENLDDTFPPDPDPAREPAEALA